MRRLDEVAWYGGYWEPEPKTYTKPPDFRHQKSPEASKDPEVLKRVGIVLGRFRPPHRGHVHLVRQAFSQCGLLYLISPKPSDQHGRSLHEVLLSASFGDHAEIATVEPPQDAQNPLAWIDAVRDVAPHATHMFSSDARAERLAKVLKLEHVLVDPDRSVHHVCARDIRTDLFGMFRWIPERARPWLGLKFGVVGPESSGKTTLARELAAEFGAVVIEDKLRMEASTTGQIPPREKFQEIIDGAYSEGQAALEESESGIAISDNTALQTIAWAARLGLSVKETPGEHCDLWLLCHDDFGFVGPPERDDPAGRRQLEEELRARLKRAKARVVEIRGTDGAARVDAAIEAIRARMHAHEQYVQKIL